MQKDFIVAFNKKNNLVFIDLNFNNLEVSPLVVFEPFVVTSVFIGGKRILDEKTPTLYTDEQMSMLFESFTQIERYLISSDFFDAALLKEEDFRKSNSLFAPRFLPKPWGEVVAYNPITWVMSYYSTPDIANPYALNALVHQQVNIEGVGFDASFMSVVVPVGGTRQNPLTINLAEALNINALGQSTRVLDLFLLFRPDIVPGVAQHSPIFNPGNLNNADINNLIASLTIGR